jgi:hypothetical protein
MMGLLLALSLSSLVPGIVLVSRRVGSSFFVVVKLGVGSFSLVVEIKSHKIDHFAAPHKQAPNQSAIILTLDSYSRSEARQTIHLTF